MRTLARLAWPPLIAILLTILPGCAQDATQNAEVPRTHTFPGVADPAFPYAEPEQVDLSSEQLARLGDEVTSWVANGDLVGAELLIVKGGRAVFHEAYGWSDREARKPVERNSIWSIKSMSKPFTATAVLMLAEEGRLSLDDPVSRYVPNFAGDERVTIRHLLSHTSGYRNEDLGDPRSYHESFGEWVEDWAARTPSGTFGEHEYTDFGFAAAGYIVEAVTDMPIGTFTEERIVAPLGLDDTRTSFSDEASWRARLNPWYRWSDEAGGYEFRWAADRAPWPFYPAAWGMFSTAMDYAAFMEMWMNGGERDGVRLLDEAIVAEALSPHAQIDGAPIYGYGWFVGDTTGVNGRPQVFDHGGGDGTLAMAFPDEELMVIWLTHSRDGTHGGALRNRLLTLDLLEFNDTMIPVDAHTETPVALSAEDRARYVGSYRTEGGGTPRTPRVWEENGRLRIRLGPLGAKADHRFDLIPFGDHSMGLGRYRDGQPHAVEPIYSIRFQDADDTLNEGSTNAPMGAIQLLEGDQVRFTARRADSATLRAEAQAMRAQVSVARLIRETLEAEDIEAAWALHRDLLTTWPDSVRFGESLLNTLGYSYLLSNRAPEAVAVFEMNAEAYPEAPNPYGSLGDGYRAADRLEEARDSYARAVELAEQAGDARVTGYRSRLERAQRELEER